MSHSLEEEPLLSDDRNISGIGSTVSVDPEQAASVTEATVNNGPSVTCRVCDHEIPLEGRTMNHVVRCGNCNEATPIRAAPPGKKYVRCPCHCLLICKASSSRIACPRENCRRVITLGPSGPVGTAIRAPAGTCRVQCCECQEIFMFNTLNNSHANCPHCKTISSVGTRYKKSRATFFFLFFISAVAASIAFTLTLTHGLSRSVIITIFTILCYIITVFFFYKFVYFLRMRVSQILGPV